MSQVTLSAGDAREVADVMTRLEQVCHAIEIELAKRPQGRPREWTAHGIVAGLLLLARHERRFHISHNENLIATLSTFQQQRLQLTRSTDPDQPGTTPLTTRQISYAWNEITRAIDPGQPRFSTTERQRRMDLLLWIHNEMLWATLDREVRELWQGDLAIDATLLWTWRRPPDRGNDKLHAGGQDGDGPPRFVSEDDDDVEFDTESSDHPVLGYLTANEPAPEEFHPNGRRRRKDRKSHAVGARHIGNKNAFKAVYGHAHHVAVICAPDGATDTLPCVAVGHVTTATTANPAATGRLLLEDIRARNHTHYRDIGLGDVLADGGYSQARAEHWQLPIRALGGDPIFRLHGTNQEGHRGAIRGGQYLHIDGRYYCRCLPEHLRSATYPHRAIKGDKPGNLRRMAAYRNTIAARRPYELKQRAKWGRKGLRFDTPHDSGCDRCAGAKRRCCSKKSVLVPWSELGTYQRHQFGTEAWAKSYGRRSRVEGFFGNLKNAMVGGHVRDTAQFAEYAKIALAFTFNAMATNLARIASWRAERAQLAAVERRTGRPTENHTLDAIAADPTIIERTKAAKRKMRRPRTRAKPIANPFAHLGAGGR